MLRKVCLLLAILSLTCTYAEVTLSVAPNGKKLGFKWENNSSIPYYLGGARFYTDGYVHPGLNSMTNWIFTQQDVNGEKEQTVLYKSSIATVQALGANNGAFQAATLDDFSGKPVEGAKRYELLLKTGSAGKVDDPVTEDPIDTSDIDSLIKTKNFYNKDYRYIDTLGAHGGLYSGGIMDTWLGETQVICHFSDETWTLHGTEQASFHLSATGGDPLFWMSVIMGQEYFHVDMQWMLGKGAQETGAGTGSYNGDNSEGAYGPWEVETGTGKSREQAYPYLFENGTIDNFWEDGSSPLNSANVVNGYIYSIVAVRYMYDLWNYALDACWKEILVESESRYYALSILLGGYNNGISDAQYVLKPFWHVDTYEDYIDNPDAHIEVEKAMNKGYVPGVIGGVKNLEKGSKNAFNDKSLELIDMELSFTDIKRFFYGEITKDSTGKVNGGDHTAQGDGGLLAHFDVDRDKFNTLIETAFNKLKGKAPSTQGKDAISLRYDFLTLLRVVKKEFLVTWVRPTGPGEWITAVKQQSQKGGCSAPVIDEAYPYGEISGTPDFTTDFVVDIHGWDNQEIKEVTWTMDTSWAFWNKATYKSGSTNDQIFTITIPRADVKAKFGDNTGTYWYMVTDASGNSVIKKDIIRGNPIKSAAAFDYDGDGFTDSLKIEIVKGALDPSEKVEDLNTLKYSWPDKNNLTDAGSDYVINDSLIMIHSMSDDAGAGLGETAIKYPSMSADATRDILDSVGPAITYASLYEGMSQDSLIIVTSEEVQNISSKNYEYLYFTKGSNETKEKSKEAIKISKDTLLFLMEKDIASDKDSVRFVYDTELTDMAGIKPQSNNIRIPIKQNGIPEPNLDSAQAKDTTGNGMADIVELHLTPSTYSDALPISNYKEMKYSWPTKSNLQAPQSVLEDGNTLTLLDSSLTGGDGLGRVTFVYGTKSYDEEIDDRVGPVITGAVLSIANPDRDKDTLVLTTSEGLANVDKKDHKYLFLDSLFETKSEKVVKLDSLTYQFIFDKDVVASKDSVKFIYNGETVEDKVGNSPIDINQWIKISIIGGKEPTLKNANIFDIDGDGRGDSVEVILNLGKAADKYTVSNIDKGKYSWPGTSLSEDLAKSDINEIDDESFSFLYDSKAEAGEGALELEFPNDYTLNGKISDKVGPVIDSAICLQIDANRDKDTLILDMSETLKENFSKDTKYLILFADSSDADGDTISVSNVEKDGSNYRFTVEKNIVAYGDWVQFVYNSGITDNVDNQPLSINRKVLINVLGGVAPRVTQAAIFDVKGANSRVDGHGDSIFVALSLSIDPKALTVDSLKEVTYSWNGTTNTKKASDLERINDSTFAITDETLTGGSGSGEITLTFLNENYSVKGKIDDAVAPVITTATYYNWANNKDTLVVTFSEELDKSGSNTPFHVTGSSIEVRTQSTNNNTVIYSIENDAELSQNDSIWIKADNEIVDTEDNEQDSDNNVRIQITYFHVASITEAAYFESDNRPDGYIDVITLYSESALNTKEFNKLQSSITLPQERNFTIGTVTRSDDNVISIEVQQNKDLSAARTTSESYDKISISETMINDTLIIAPVQDLSLKDSLAPVILSARYVPADEGNETLIDTLRVNYSEKVKVTSFDEPFRFSDASDKDEEYSLKFDNDAGGENAVSYTNIYKQVNVLPGAGDSVWIYEHGTIEDEKGNVQEHNTVPVPLTVQNYNRNFKVSIAPTPFNLTHYEDSMVTIRIQPQTRILPADIQATFVIYDKVGNIVKEVSYEEFGEVEDEMLKYSFRPNNTLDRRLGAGTYQIELFINADGDQSRHPLKLGVAESSLNKESKN